MHDPANWMLSEAIDTLARAERMHRQLFQLQRSHSRAPAWEPPLDMIETDHEVLILIALPGVEPDQVEAIVRDGTLMVAGRRVLPPELRTARIHRLELPQGQFERHVPLPPGRYRAVHRFARNGCVVFSLEKDV
ncbi:Hsp20/alpha crystallin family protein [Microvirga sp. Mcv34]|uniref:Hsp20/alpha crystallin family protein n=1 Tax=Microvirga sp. Mcv34 TaxID=2926016 RepID=UPI0021C88DA0|nr:Hsp20/alpha crystallin family protein [Microvirga sp. Mcv34]